MKQVIGAIDAHQHFWHYDAREYGWIDDSMAAIRRDFLPGDLQVELAREKMEGSVSVQARQSMEETRWLLGLAAQNKFIRGVVGWAPLAASDVHDILGALSANAHLRGIRHVVQGEPDDRFLLGADFNRGVSQLLAFHLTYDILIFARHLPYAYEFVDRHPYQTFVLDHIAKPAIKDHTMQPWADNIRALAKRPHVYCKLSGMVTEADYRTWRKQDLQPYFDVVLEAFGPDRLMFGSDWPVCLAATTYRKWFELVNEWIQPLSQSEQEMILRDNARKAYRL